MRLTYLALALAGGISIGRISPTNLLWPWLALATVFLVGGEIVWRRKLPRLMMSCLIGATGALGAGGYLLHGYYRSPSDLAAMIGEEPVLVRMKGVAQASPKLRDRTSGSMATFDYRPAATYFPLTVEMLIGRDGKVHPVKGSISVRVDETIAPFRAGDGIEVMGILRAPRPPGNPGEFDYQRLSRSNGQAGSLVVASRRLLTVTPAKRSHLYSAWLNWRDSLRRRARGWLLSNLPDDDKGERAALLSALLLGQREKELDGVSESFRRVGLAHLLAISGLHLGVMAGFVLLILRWFSPQARWHGWLLIVVVIGYLILVEVRLPVLRAGIMTIMASLALVTGSRLRVTSLVSGSAILLLVWKPDQLFTPGFQLSFGVVLGIIHFSPILRERWFKKRNMMASSTAQMIGQWLRTTMAVTATAWMVATPITAYHFGVISPLAVPLSVVAVPLVAVLLAIGYTKIVLTMILPSAAMLLGVPLTVGADSLLSTIAAIDALPGSAIHVPFPSAWWTAAGLLWVCAFVNVRSSRTTKAALWTALGLIVGWLYWPVISPRASYALRIDMLAVGDGSCFVIRSGGRTALFDAGSSTDLDAGRRSILPALRRLGVTSIDFIAVSHSNLDHYSAVLELVDEFGVGRVLVTPQMLRTATDEPDESLSYLLDGLSRRFVQVQPVAAGYQLQLGESSWTWIHPAENDRYPKPNDESMVVRIDAAGRRVLLCGDIQKKAITSLTDRYARDTDMLTADIVELPHHGSFNPAVIGFIEIVNPRIVMQSTGYRRWRADRWEETLADRLRLVTARDGACSIRVDHAGGLRTGRFHAP